jgi:flagellar basal-body rod protein FlgB
MAGPGKRPWMDEQTSSPSMGLYDITQIGLESAIRGASARQSAIASNVANANTPGYKRQDVDFHSALQGAMSSGASASALDSMSFSPTTDDSAPMQADGNSVDIDVEQANLAKNGLEYESLVSVEKARIDILKAAMGVT